MEAGRGALRDCGRDRVPATGTVRPTLALPAQARGRCCCGHTTFAMDDYIYILGFLCSGAGYNSLARAANEEEKLVDVSSRERRNEEAVTDDDDDDGDTNVGHGGGETRV